MGDNLDIDRPENVGIIFGRKIRRDVQRTFKTAIDHPVTGQGNAGVILVVFCKHSRIKQCREDDREPQIETVISRHRDLGCNARLPNLAEL